MANLLDQITVGDIKILVLDGEPTGYSAEVGSIAAVPSSGALYYRDLTDWTELITNAGLPEKVQDAVAGALSGSANITFTYNDGANTISADLTDTAVSAGTFGTAAKTVTVAVDSKGRVTSLVDQDILINAAQVSDFGAAVESHLGFNVAKSSAVTTDGTSSDILNIAIPENSSALVKTYISGLSAGNGALAYERTAAVKNVAGTLTVLSVQSDYTSEENPLGPSNVTIAASGTNVVVRLNGTNGQTINWKGTLQVHKG